MRPHLVTIGVPVMDLFSRAATIVTCGTVKSQLHKALAAVPVASSLVPGMFHGPQDSTTLGFRLARLACSLAVM